MIAFCLAAVMLSDVPAPPEDRGVGYRWVKVTDEAAFAPRDGAGALTFRGRMWLIGGWNPGDKVHFPRICSNDVWSSTDGARWSPVRPNTFLDKSFDPEADWEGRHTAGYAVFRDKMWIVGGDVNQGHYQSDVWNSSDGKDWTLVNRGQPVPWGPRALHYTLVFRDRIWVLGGQTMPGFAAAPETFYRDVWNTADGVRWERVAPEEPYWPARGMIGGAVVFKGRMWILGGGTYDTPTTPARRFYNDVWSSPDGVRWERHVEHAPWAPRQYHDVAVFDDRMWVLEGYSGANRNDVWYSEDGVDWHELPGTPWSPRHAASVFVFDDALWVVAGNNMEPDVWKLVRREPFEPEAWRTAGPAVTLNGRSAQMERYREPVMLSLLAARGAGGVTRRQALRLGLGGFAGLALPSPANAGAGSVRPKATRGIFIFLCGGPSQLDLWDPKPEAPAEIRGAFRPIETSAPGVRFTELIPSVARHADKLAVLRSMTHDSPDHNMGIAHTLGGRRPSRPDDVFVAPGDHPALGAILHKLRGDSGLSPPWVILPRPFTTLSPPHKGQSAGFLGSAYDAVTLNEPRHDSLAPKDLKFDAFDLPPEVGPDRSRARRDLLAASEAGPNRPRPTPADERWASNFDKSVTMLETESCRRAFDLTREDPRLRDRYGRNEYGQSFLLARRLVESGVRFVNVFWTFFDEKGCQFNLWDNHGVMTDVCGVGGARTGLDMIKHPYCTPSFDRAFSALLEDLECRGLLDETLVAVAGDFGRTPRINAMAGRDHWPNCYTQLLAGGGIRGGTVYGASDRNAAYVKDRPVSPADFHATILHAFGLSPDATILDPLDRPVRISEGTPLVSLFG